MRLLLPLLFLFLSFPAFARQEAPVVTQECGCESGHRFDIKDSEIAFKGRVKEITESRQNVRGFEFTFVDITFAIETVWRGLPEDTAEFTIRTDSTSCGYGRILAPDGQVNAIGGTYGVFAKEPIIDLCNSVVVDETWFPKHLNPLVSENQTPRRPLGYWSTDIPEGWYEHREKELKEEQKRQKEEATSPPLSEHHAPAEQNQR
jgi:hypothetical protein